MAPTDVGVVAPTPTPVLTLTTCNPRYSATQRLVVQAALVADVLTGSSAPSRATPSGHGGAGSAAAAAVQRHWWQAIAWGIVVAALITGIWAFALRLRGRRRVALLVVGLTAWLVVVFVFFGALAPLLPASY